MKPGAELVNSAQGGIVDEDALVQAIDAGAIGGEALNVFKQAVDGIGPAALRGPRVAGVTEESNDRVGRLIAERLISHLEGRT